MKRCLFLAAVLAGCATVPQESPQQFVHRTSSPILCYMHYAGNQTDRGMAEAELAARSFHCTERDVRDGFVHLRQVQAEQAQMAAQRAQGERVLTQRLLGAAAGLAASSAAAPVYAPPIVCNTTTNGRTTVCN